MLLFFAGALHGFSQGIETQRKYGFDLESNLKGFIKNSGELTGFSTFNHSNLTYYDLYFDTPNFALAEQGYSLRMRKKEDGADGFAYVFQLKSEMETANGIRMEVEETELDFYYLFHANQKINLPSFIDSLFSILELIKENGDADSYQPYLNELAQWIDFKAGAPLIPFQKLHHLLPGIFSEEGLKKLRPVLIGYSVRSRSHVFLSAENSLTKMNEVLINRTIESETPAFFKTNPTACWLFESSLDASVFYPLFPCTKHSVIMDEFELENKFQNGEQAAVLLDEFEASLKKEYGIYTTLNSKYLQSVLAFRE